MMRRIVVLGASLAALSATVGCEKRAQDEQERAVKAQNEANQKAAEADRESTTKTTSAQAEADRKIAEANKDFAKLHEDYRHKTQKNFDDLVMDIDKLDAKATAATGKKKADLEAAVHDIQGKREVFRANFSALGDSTAATWDAQKEMTEKSWDALKAAVDRATSL